MITAAVLILLTAIVLIAASGRIMNNFAEHWTNENTNTGATL